MAAQLRAEASAMAAEQAKKVSESTQKAFSKFDLDSNGVIDLVELKLGLEKAIKSEVPETRVQQVMKKFDRNGDGVLQLEEFVTVDQLRNQLDSLVREEKAIALEQTKQAQKEEEEARLREIQMAILNDGEPTNSEKIISVAPYLFPFLEVLQYASLYITKHPENVFAQIAAVLFTVYHSIPLSGFLTFFGLSILSGNPSLNRLIRFNIQQAIYLDIALFVPGLFSALLGSKIPLEIMEIGGDAVVVTMLLSIAYASASSLLGQTPDKIPFLSSAVEKRMMSPDMFDVQGKFVEPRDEDEQKK